MSKIIQTHIKHFDDIQYTVVATVDGDYKVDYKAYRIVGTSMPDEKRLYEAAGATSSMETVESLDKAAVYLSGHVKWDGCSNWTFDEQDNCAIHFCDRDGLQHVGELMAQCWDWTAELCTAWDDVVCNPEGDRA